MIYTSIEGLAEYLGFEDPRGASQRATEEAKRLGGLRGGWKGMIGGWEASKEAGRA